MSNHRKQNNSAVISHLKNIVKTARLFGEEDFLLPQQDKIPLPSLPPLVKGKETTGSKEPGDLLEALYKKYANCQNCQLSRTRKKIVFGMGSPSPQVLFVGEGPGYEEDKSGLPFVGKAGTLLDNILKAIGLSREKVYIANIVKCHPLKDPSHPEMRGNDRPPSDIEIEACRQILDEQIEILNPPVICALGSTAAKMLLKRVEGISRLRGKVYDFSFPRSEKIVPLIPTYHPAACLRNELLKKDVWQDMKLLMKKLKEIVG